MMGGNLSKLYCRLRMGVSEIGQDWFFPENPYWKGKLDILWGSILYLAGLIQWGNFFSWGRIDFNTGDWNDITGPRLHLIRDAALRLELPLHITNPLGLKGVTDRLLSIPDFFVSPQFFLLRYLDPGIFILVDMFLFYSIGFAGLLYLCKRMKLSKSVWVILFFIFNFNGHITAHLSCGHITWLGYFLMPFFVLFVFEMPHPFIRWGWILKISLLGLLFYAQGSYHLWTGCILFLAFLGLFKAAYRKNAFLGIVCSLLMNAFRILPAALISGDLKVDYLTGFLDVGELINSLVKLVQPSEALLLTTNKITHYIGWWEVDFFIGWMGFLFIIISHLYLGWLVGSKKITNRFSFLYLPVICMVTITVGRVFKPVFLLHIPLLEAERVPSRFLIVPLLILFVSGAWALQTFFNRFPIYPITRIVYFASLLWLINDLQQHFELWSVSNANQVFLPAIGPAIFEKVNNHADPPYFISLAVGLLISIVVLVFLVVQFYRQRRVEKQIQING